MRRAALATILAVLVVPGVAHAGWKIDRARAIADIVWQSPATRTVEMRWAPLPRSATEETGAIYDPEQHAVTINASVAWPWPKFCTMWIHEAGHAAGVGHSDNPLSVMFPEFGPGMLMVAPTSSGRLTLRPDSDRRCHARGRPYLERHGEL